jgi:hypothetical protein
MSTSVGRAKEIAERLRAAANADGGWGYYAAHPSRLEPTCWALLGLRSAGALDSELEARAGETLRQWQRRDGLLVDVDGRAANEANFAFNALAAWVALQIPAVAARLSLEPLVAAISRAKGVKLPPSTINRQDDSLQGWSWIDGTFSWVEPTCWGLIALKRARETMAIDSSRVDEAEKLLADRCCVTGGWNYGNSNMLGKELHPYVPTTALALLALQDRRQRDCVVRSVEFLTRNRLSERSAMALGLVAIALRTFGEPVDDIHDALIEQYRKTAFLGNAHLTGVALYGLA